jgi:AraC family transcriptional activator of mtrCDE
MPTNPTLNRLLTALDVAPHAFSVCRIQSGWRMSFPVFKVITVHFVLRGSGHVQAGGAAPLPFAPSSVLVVPALLPHWVGDADQAAATGAAADQCELIGDGLVEFTAGNGDDDTLLLCAAVSAPHQAVLGLFDLVRWPAAYDIAASGVPAAIFDAMRREVTNAGLGTQAMCQALMKQAMITLLRERWAGVEGAPVAEMLHHPRLARAIVAIIERPGADHSVGSLADLAGMSRASFSDHFSRAFGQGPIDFVQKTRLRVAARLLRVTDLPIEAIAQSVGYAGSRPFSRAFTATYGALPSMYRLSPPAYALVPEVLPPNRDVSDRPD